jgi:flagellar biosynthetic protein FliR
MLTVTSTQLLQWLAAFLWPLARILGFFLLAPIFGNRSVPTKVKVGFGVTLAVLVAPTLGALPPLDPVSLSGVLILAQQTVIGLAMGFAMRLIFSAIELAGEMIGLTMGLGFATFFDPQSQGRTSAINQFFSLLAVMVFLAADFHLLMINTIADSFVSMPIGAPVRGLNQLVFWATNIFTLSLQLSLPVVGTLLATNVALGILTRAAPQLNLFGIGFPITLAVGMLMIAVMLPHLATHFQTLFHAGLAEMQQMTAAPAPQR